MELGYSPKRRIGRRPGGSYHQAGGCSGQRQSICDLGCGNGYITGRLAALGYDVIGIDASESGIRIASENHPQARFICSLIDEDLRERATLETFDLVISSDAIEHFYRPGELLSAAVSLFGSERSGAAGSSLSRLSKESCLECNWEDGRAF